MNPTILIVDDEESVRRTIHEWLAQSDLGCTLLSAADAESALQHANREAIDLAILDWNLGSGNDGLQLLEDLSLFQPDIVAILITGYAHQATPLHALRMGVRDYLDKNQDFTREAFLRAVRKQVRAIVPAKRHRQLLAALVAFRDALGQILPLVRTSAALRDPAPLAAVVSVVCQSLRELTGAAAASVVVRRAREGDESAHWYGSDGEALADEAIPFARSLAAAVAGMQEVCTIPNLEAVAGSITLHSSEVGRRSLLAAPLALAGGSLAVVQLFDPPAGQFADADRRLLHILAPWIAQLFHQRLAEAGAEDALTAAVRTALEATEGMDAPTEAAPVAERMREQLRQAEPAADDGALELAEAIRALAQEHGPLALRHCMASIAQLSAFLKQYAQPSPEPWSRG